MIATCSIDGCNKANFGRGWCHMHWNRWKRNGHPEKVAQVQGDDLYRLRQRYVEDESGCWLWVGECNDNGYGRFSVKGRKVYAHRSSYEIHVGPIPEGLHIDHLCRVRNCVNPEHLEPVTRSENVRRGIRARAAA